MEKVEPTYGRNISNASCEKEAEKRSNKPKEDKSFIKTLMNSINPFGNPKKRRRVETSSLSSRQTEMQTQNKMRVETIVNKPNSNWMHANHGTSHQGSLYQGSLHQGPVHQGSFQKGFPSSEESRRKEIQTAKWMNLERLQREMKQIELEGQAKVDSINREKKEELQKLDEEKIKKIREDETSARNTYNSDLNSLKKEVKEKQTQIRTQHEKNMDRLNGNGKLYRN